MIYQKYARLMAFAWTLLLVSITACNASTVTNSSSVSGEQTSPPMAAPATATPVPEFVFTGNIRGTATTPGICDGTAHLQWSGLQLTDMQGNPVTMTLTIALYGNISVNWSYPLIADQDKLHPPSPGAAVVSLNDSTTEYVSYSSRNGQVSIGATTKTGTIAAPLINTHDPTKTVTIHGTWFCGP